MLGELPTPIQQEINEIASSRNNEVMSLAYTRYSRKVKYKYKPAFHKGKTDNQLLLDSCTCAYCKNLKLYVKTKLSHHRLKKSIDKYDSYGYYLNNMDEFERDMEMLQSLKEEIKKYKRKKDIIKSELSI